MLLEAASVAVFLLVFAWIVGQHSRLRLRFRLELAAAMVAVLVAACYVIVKRIEDGLGAVTHLSDGFPWGIWITADLCGVALASGGFLVAATVHILGVRRFEPILRPIVLTAFIAYMLVAAILVFDLGRPYRFWHPLIMWQPHSVMFEITLCLTLYSVVLALEFSPALFERLGWHRGIHLVHAMSLPVVITGVILSTLHQSSFGSLFLIVPQRLSPLWYTPILPLLFLLSAACAGLAMVVLESHVCATVLRKQLPPALMVELGRACSVTLWVYLAAKLIDLTARDAWSSIEAVPWLGAAWLAEILAGVLIPAVWLLRIPRQGPPRGLIAASALVMGGVVLNRMNISWFGLLPASASRYVPSWMELVIVAAGVLAGMLAFMAVARFLPVFPEAEAGPIRKEPDPHACPG